MTSVGNWCWGRHLINWVIFRLINQIIAIISDYWILRKLKKSFFCDYILQNNLEMLVKNDVIQSWLCRTYRRHLWLIEFIDNWYTTSNKGIESWTLECDIHLGYLFTLVAISTKGLGIYLQGPMLIERHKLHWRVNYKMSS